MRQTYSKFTFTHGSTIRVTITVIWAFCRHWYTGSI